MDFKFPIIPFDLDKQPTEEELAHWNNDQTQLSEDLKAIAQVESAGGKNKAHARINYGLNKGHRAGGQTGLMPITVKEILQLNPDLSEKYGEINTMSPDQITEFINKNESVENELANRHWEKLNNIFKEDELRRAFAWNQGVTGAKRAQDATIINHPYIQKYLKAKEVNRLKKLLAKK